MMVTASPPTSSGQIHDDLIAVEAAQTALQHVQARLRSQQSVVEQQQQAIDQLRAEVGRLQSERDIYLNSLYTLTRDEKVSLSPEKLKHLKESGLTFDEMMVQIERINGR